MNVNTDTLESMCDLIVDCPHSTPKWTNEGIIVLRNQNIKNGVLDLSSPSFTNEEDYQKRIKRAVPQAGDIVFTREAPMGKVCMIPEGLKCCLGQRQVLLRPKSNIYGEYLFWVLQSPFVQHQISWNEGTGSTVSNVRIPVLKALGIPRHPDDEEKIAKVLSDLAGKIETNRQTNQTLEHIAQAIFKSWFVDFDPTRAKISAKENGQDPELAAMTIIAGKTIDELGALSDEMFKKLKSTAALFPDSFEESELGQIPEGWNVGSISDLCSKVESGGTPSRKETKYWDGGDIPWLTSGEVRKAIVIKSNSFITKAGLQNSSAKLWQPLTTIVAMYGATAGQITLLACETSANQACCALIPKEDAALYVFFKARNSVQVYEGKASGSAQQNLNKSIVSNLEVILPSQAILKRFEMMVSPNIFKMISNEKENFTLEQIRDALLPKLLSGELEVASAN